MAKPNLAFIPDELHLTGVSRNSPTPAKATISSNFDEISARRIPATAPCRKTFSRAVRSGWKPAAASMSAPTRPTIAERPMVGLRLRVSSFRMVDLPAPLGPMMPSASPGRTAKERSRTAQNSCSASSDGARSSLSIRLTTAGTTSRRLWECSPRRNFFHTPSTTTRGSLMVRLSLSKHLSISETAICSRVSL